MARKDGNKEAAIAIIRRQQKAQVTAQISDSPERGMGDDDDGTDGGVGDDDDGVVAVHAGGVPAIKRVGAMARS